jgi:hypothetical protein
MNSRITTNNDEKSKSALIAVRSGLGTEREMHTEHNKNGGWDHANCICVWN